MRKLKGNSRITCVAISFDNKYILSGSIHRRVRVWGRKSGKLLYRLTGHSDELTSVAISRDNRFIVSGSWDSTVRIWKL